MTVSFVNDCYFNSGFSVNGVNTSNFLVTNNVTGWLTPAEAGAVDQKTYRYRAATSDQTQWETGYGVYDASNTVLERNTIIHSSNYITQYVMTNKDGSISVTQNLNSTVNNYTTVPFDAAANLVGCVVGNGIGVVIANGFVWTSNLNDFTTWTKNTNLSNTYIYNGLAFDGSNTFYIVTSNTSSNYPYILSSTDANTWAATQANDTLFGGSPSMSGASLLGVYASGNTIIATSEATSVSNTYIWMSNDKGTTWSSNTTSANVALNHIVGYNGKYMTFYSNERTAASTKLYLFSNTSSITSVDLTTTFSGAFGAFGAAYGSNNTIVIADGKFTGATYTDAILTSQDNGTTWTQYSANVADTLTYGIRSIVWDGSKFIAASYDIGSSGYSTSVDGVHWTALTGYDYGVQGPIQVSSSYQLINFSENPKVALTIGIEDIKNLIANV